MKIITIGGWDCCPYIHSIWINPDISPSHKVNLGDFDNDDDPVLLVAALKKAGFKQAKSQEITFGGNL